MDIVNTTTKNLLFKGFHDQCFNVLNIKKTNYHLSNDDWFSFQVSSSRLFFPQYYNTFISHHSLCSKTLKHAKEFRSWYLSTIALPRIVTWSLPKQLVKAKTEMNIPHGAPDISSAFYFSLKKLKNLVQK